MKTTKTLTVVLSGLILALFTSCSASKLSEPNAPSNSSALNVSSQKPMASCNRKTDNHFSFDLSVYTDGSGQINYDWIKLKFRYLSSDVTQSGYTLRFYKWRMIGSTSQLDSTPLNFASYNISSGQSSANTANTVLANQISTQTGLYIQLRDDAQNPYQALKVVAYKSDGTVLAQTDVLIPQFAASPADYQFDNNGNARANNLIQMHPLANTNVSQWTTAQMQQYFSAYCF
ncbi:hypothetical protein [Pseudobdellovibrio exovorus]|uniref:Lipoprotein n=1 Tax=Pseudobdellovibrio exovorus JSS TaxID=1184267 RepID=M4V8Y0_9BACT|nr:hypothetical protein [Pseudobdellovibrio exovorus]AGH95862.1 hypothetical protein A11Q_1646 [Pseudobdellovibrio exovorus JSS]